MSNTSRLTSNQHDDMSLKILMGILVAIVIFLIFADSCLKNLPEFGHPAMRISKNYIETALAKTGATNIVTSVILDFRAYDTLGEATVLFAAVIGAMAILRKTGRKK